MSRATACFSMYSDMSMRTIDCSSSNRNSARARAVSVFPTPVGPRKMNEPIGRLGSCRPARELAVELRQALALAFHHPRDGDAGPSRDDFGDVFRSDLFLQELRPAVV